VVSGVDLKRKACTMAEGDGGGAPPNTRIPLRVLLVEDSEIDAEVVLRALRRGGYEPTGERVETAPALTAALERQEWDVITCDWGMPQFSAPAVLALLQDYRVDLPIIIVSNRAGEEYAVTAMKAGAHDFVSKDNLARLCPAIARELAEVEVRRARQHAEAELKRLAAAVEMMAEGVCLIRVGDAVILHANRTFETMFGYAPGQLRGQPVSTLNAPGAKSPEETAREIMVELRARGSWAGEVHNRKMDGTEFWSHATVSALADREHGDLWVAVHMDMTEEKQAEEAVRTSEALLHSIAEGTSDAVYVKDMHGRYLLSNAAAARFVGKSIEEVLGKDDTALFAPNEARQVMEADHHVMASGVMRTFEEFVTTNGVGRTFLSTKGPVRDAHGNVIGLFGIARDITEHKRLHEQILRTKSFLDSIVENIPNMVFVKDAKSLAFVLFNRAGEDLLGQRRVDLIGKTDYDFFPKEQADFFTGKDRAVLHEKAVLDIPEELINTGHGQRILHTKKIPILDDTGTPAYLLGISEDITDLKHAQEQLHARQAELAHALRVNTLGEITAELAHEIHQPMSAIANYANGCRRLIASGATSPKELLPAIEAIATEALRAGGIIRRLRALLQKQATPYQDTDLNAVVTNAVHVLAPQAHQLGIPIRVDLAPELPRIQLDQIQIEQVIVNLMLNALEAMQMGDSVAPELLLHTVCPGNGTVEVSVEDRGIGFTPAISKRMFEPFYTSKPSGLGMGLSISRSIVERHGGRLWATSNTDGGATFHLALPLVVQKENEKPES